MKMITLLLASLMASAASAGVTFQPDSPLNANLQEMISVIVEKNCPKLGSLAELQTLEKKVRAGSEINHFYSSELAGVFLENSSRVVLSVRSQSIPGEGDEVIAVVSSPTQYCTLP